MVLVKVFYEDPVIYICYVGKRLRISNVKMKHVLELFWNHPAIKQMVLVRKTEKGRVLSKRIILDKAETPYSVPLNFNNKNE